MPPLWKPKDTALLTHWVDTILKENSKKLTKWERNFVSDMHIRLLNNWQLSQTQEEKLEQIYADRTK